MGDARPPPTSTKEHILALLPFPPDQKILDSIQKKHPNVDFDYETIQFTHGVAVVDNMPAGTHLSKVNFSLMTTDIL